MEFTPEEDSRPALLLAAPTPGYNLLFLHLPSALRGDTVKGQFLLKLGHTTWTLNLPKCEATLTSPHELTEAFPCGNERMANTRREGKTGLKGKSQPVAREFPQF